jgi:hypothetical protein
VTHCLNFSLNCPLCKCIVLCHIILRTSLRPLWLCRVLRNYLVHGRIVGIKIICVIRNVCFDSSCISETYLTLGWIRRDIIINVLISLWKHLIFLSDFNLSWIFWIHLIKVSIIAFHDKPSNGRQLFHADEYNSNRT